MPAYSHLLDEERDQIAVMRAAGRSICAIAGALQRAKSTVSRELRRNALPSGRYSPLHAAGAYQLRRRREAILEKDPTLRTFVRDRLAEGWAPEQIAGWLKAGNERGLRGLGFEAIYAFIYRAAHKGEDLWRYLTPPTNTVVRADQGLREIPSRIAFPSTNGPRTSMLGPKPAIGRATSSSASARGQCSFSMSANPA